MWTRANYATEIDTRNRNSVKRPKFIENAAPVRSSHDVYGSLINGYNHSHIPRDQRRVQGGIAPVAEERERRLLER